MAIVVITGANRGIGLEAALAFARRGDTVVATMRDPTRAEQLLDRAAQDHLKIQVAALDLTFSATFSAAVKGIIDTHGGIDVLINNAGLHRAGALEDIDEATLRRVVEVNCVGPLLLTRAVLPVMREQRGGLVIMMSSLSGIAGLPGDVPYSASKFALEGATEALRQEVARWNIRVALVQAGMYATGIMEANLARPGELPGHYPADSPYQPLIRWQLEQLRRRLPEAFDPANVARVFVDIAASDSTQLRWPADAVARRVLDTMLAQTDEQRNGFLEEIADVPWWMRGDVPPAMDGGEDAA